MATKLDKILDEIDPSRTIDDVENLINNAFASYYREKNTVDSWNEIEPCLADIFRTLENAALSIGGEFRGNVGFDGSRAMHLLSQEYGSNQTVYDIMLSGAEGGIYSILKALARLMAEEYSRNEIGARVSDWWESLSTEEKLEAPDEYLRKFSEILPQSVIQDNYRLKAYFWQVLEEHPRLIKRIRDQG